MIELTEQDRETFVADGFVIVDGVLNADIAAEGQLVGALVRRLTLPGRNGSTPLAALGQLIGVRAFGPTLPEISGFGAAEQGSSWFQLAHSAQDASARTRSRVSAL